jgi:hypothetical protein
VTTLDGIWASDVSQTELAKMVWKNLSFLAAALAMLAAFVSAQTTSSPNVVRCPCAPLYRASEWTEGSNYITCHILPTIESLKRRDPAPSAMVHILSCIL